MKELLLFSTSILHLNLVSTTPTFWNGNYKVSFHKKKDISFGVENNFQMILIGFLTDLVTYLI